MLTRLEARGFKSLNDLEIEFPRLTVLFGPNASGKSNILEAALMLSRIGTQKTLDEAFGPPIRGRTIEAFAFPPGGLPDLYAQKRAHFSLEADLATGAERLRYRAGVEIQPSSGALTVCDEYLSRLNKDGKPKGTVVIEVVGDQLYLRPRHKGRPPGQNTGLNYVQLSDRRLGGPSYELIDRCREEFDDWRVYYLDPRVAMRSARAPAVVTDIGVLGDGIAPYLHHLRSTDGLRFAAVRRTLQTLIPSVQDLQVDLDEKRGELDIQIRQDGRSFSSRIISEGTLRVLALCAIAVHPRATGLVAFEEPENGVHPRRLELIAQLLSLLALDQGKQVIVTTHSPPFCAAVLRLTKERPDDVGMLAVRHRRDSTEVSALEHRNGLFRDQALAQSLAAGDEDGLFEGLLLRGLQMGSDILVDLFAEDRAHEALIGPLVERVAGDLGKAVELRPVSARGGHGRAINEFQGYQQARRKGLIPSPSPDVIVVAIDANCRAFSEARKEIREATEDELRDRCIEACPDPHIERWYLADLVAFHQVVGLTPDVPNDKCQRDFYKDILAQAVKDAGHPATLGGIEFAREIAEAMNFFRAGKSESSLKHFLDDLSDALKQL